MARFGRRPPSRPIGNARTPPHGFASWLPGCRTPCPALTWTRCGLRRRAKSLLHRALTYPVSDLALHSWDVYRSQDRLVELPEGLLAFCRELVESVPENMLRRPGGFGPAQPVPEDATPTARLMAYLGRSVDVKG